MDRDRIEYICPECKHEEMHLYYASDCRDYMDGLLSGNAAKEKEVLAKNCPGCTKGRLIRKSQYLEEQDVTGEF